LAVLSLVLAVQNRYDRVIKAAIVTRSDLFTGVRTGLAFILVLQQVFFLSKTIDKSDRLCYDMINTVLSLSPYLLRMKTSLRSTAKPLAADSGPG